MLLVDEVVLEGAPHPAKETVEVAIGVQEGSGLAVAADLRPGEHLEHLVERAVAAGQADEGFGQRVHARLAHLDIGHDLQLRQPGGVDQLRALQTVGHHADDPAPRGQRAFRQRAHHAGAPGAVHQGDPLLGQQAAGVVGGLVVLRREAVSRTAEHADRTIRIRHGNPLLLCEPRPARG